LLACTRILSSFYQHLPMPISPCHTNATDCEYTHLYVCALNFLTLRPVWRL
jgi:hypothetical protein